MKKSMISRFLSVTVSAMLITATAAGCAAKTQAPSEAEPAQSIEAEEETEAAKEQTEEQSAASEDENAVAGDQSTASEDENTAAGADSQAESANEAETEVSGAEEPGASSAALPAYEYPGPEAFYYDMYKFIIDEFSGDYEKAEVCIPCVQIVAEEMEDPEDNRVYGIFSVFNYNLNGDILECVSGGVYPGVIHVKKDLENGGYVFTKAEIVENGTNYTESAKKIFGDHYDDFEKLSADDKAGEETRAQIIANYVAANDLKISAYQDYGWDPVTLPEENIDSFYSILD